MSTKRPKPEPRPLDGLFRPLPDPVTPPERRK